MQRAGERAPTRRGDELSVRRAALLQVNGRRVNEAIDRGAQDVKRSAFVCECGNIGCNALVELHLTEYEAVREDFDRFLVIPGHEVDGVDEVVERRDGYVVVAKIGTAAAIAADTDPRSGAGR